MDTEGSGGDLFWDTYLFEDTRGNLLCPSVRVRRQR